MSDQPQSLTIRTGIRLLVNDDPARVIAFDPDDVQFAERFYGLYRAMFGDVKRYEARAAFGDSLSIDAVMQFFEGVMPFIQNARSERVAKYAKPKGKGRKVMK